MLFAISSMEKEVGDTGDQESTNRIPAANSNTTLLSTTLEDRGQNMW